MIQGMKSSSYTMTVSAVGSTQVSKPVKMQYDMACAGAKIELIIVADQAW